MNKQKYLTISTILILALSLSLAGISYNVSARPFAAATPVGLGTADNFAVLAGSAITNTGPTTITGDVGTFPTTTETGFAAITLNGTNHAGDAVTQGAKTDLTTAYNDTAGRGPTAPIAADLGGRTLVPGVYNSESSIGLTGTLTLDGGGDPNAVFIFQAGSSLTTASASKVILTNNTQSCNVYWQIGSSATLGTTSTFIGTIMAMASITDDGGSKVDGRFLARNAAVTLNHTTLSRPICAAAQTQTAMAPTSTPTPTPTPTPAPTATLLPIVTGLPNTGGGPIRSEDSPWSLVILGGFSAIVLVVGIRRWYRSTNQPKQ